MGIFLSSGMTDPKTNQLKQKPDYGIDAPGVIRNLLLIGLALLILPLIFPHIKIGKTVINYRVFYVHRGYLRIGTVDAALFSLWKIFSPGPSVKPCYMTGENSVLDVGQGRVVNDRGLPKTQVGEVHRYRYLELGNLTE